ncbi:endonuclease/exonuclease/phosphatase family protein [Bacteroides sp.]
MKHFGKVFSYLILAVNAFFVGILLLTAYSPYIHPTVHSAESCMGLTFPIFLVINFCFLIFWLIVRYKFALLPILGFALCYPQIRTYIPINFHTQDIPEGSIKILSYNIMSFGNMEKENGKNAVLEYLRQSNADIICLQEHNISLTAKIHLNAKEVQEGLKMYPYKHIQHVGKEGGNNGIAIYSKYPILSARKLEYESSYNGSAIYELKINEDTITVINNHLESNKLTKEDKVVYEEMLKDPNAHKVKSGTRHLVRKLAEASAIRAKQADVIAAEIAASRHPYIIVCGDFNDTAISYTHRVISENLNDAFTESGQGLGISYNQNKFYFRIDNILISKNLKAYNCTVDRSIKDSDHYPIWCYVNKR